MDQTIMEEDIPQNVDYDQVQSEIEYEIERNLSAMLDEVEPVS